LDILKVSKIDPNTSKLGFLYEELFLVRSQILRNQGQHWRSAWDLQLAQRWNTNKSEDMIARANLARGIRMLRLGFADLAKQEFLAAAHSLLPNRQRIRARIGLIQALRFSGAFEDCLQEIHSTQKISDIDQDQFMHLDWEKISLLAQREHDLNPMIKAVSARGTHHTSGYFLEAFLWQQAIAKEKWAERLPKVRSVGRSRSLGAIKEGFIYKACIALEQCQLSETPLTLHLDNLGEVIANRHQLISVEWELLLLAAAGRWLVKKKQNHLAILCYKEYSTLLNKLANTNDPFRLLEEKLDTRSAA
jgi:hypothetical protein